MYYEILRRQRRSKKTRNDSIHRLVRYITGHLDTYKQQNNGLRVRADRIFKLLKLAHMHFTAFSSYNRKGEIFRFQSASNNVHNNLQGSMQQTIRSHFQKREKKKETIISQ